jgi:hypothetical protein
MIIITKPKLPNYVTLWEWEEVRNAVAGVGDEPTFYMFRFKIANQGLNLGLGYTDLTTAQNGVRGEGEGWQNFWDTMFEKYREKIEATNGGL